MQKPCAHKRTMVFDSRRPAESSKERLQKIITTRRRECQLCGHRFSTIEIAGDDMAAIIKDLNVKIMEQFIQMLERSR